MSNVLPCSFIDPLNVLVNTEDAPKLLQVTSHLWPLSLLGKEGRNKEFPRIAAFELYPTSVSSVPASAEVAPSGSLD